jgi:VanZ family protein
LTVPKPSQHYARAWLWPFLVAGVIFYASCQSKVAAPGIVGIDKISHFSVYGLLATLVVRLRGGRRAALFSILIVSLYGITDEWHQSFTPGRSVEVADWLADTLGAALAVTLYRGWAAYRGWLEKPLWAKRRIENEAPAPTISNA